MPMFQGHHYLVFTPPTWDSNPNFKNVDRIVLKHPQNHNLELSLIIVPAGQQHGGWVVGIVDDIKIVHKLK